MAVSPVSGWLRRMLPASISGSGNRDGNYRQKKPRRCGAYSLASCLPHLAAQTWAGSRLARFTRVADHYHRNTIAGFVIVQEGLVACVDAGIGSWVFR